MVRADAHALAELGESGWSFRGLLDLPADAPDHLKVWVVGWVAVGPASLAGSKPRLLGKLGHEKEYYLVVPGETAWARGPAVDACGPHSADERTVATPVPFDHRLPARVGLNS